MLNPSLILFSYRHDLAYSGDTSRAAIRQADTEYIQENLAILSKTKDPVEFAQSSLGALGISAKRAFEDVFGQVYPKEMAPVQPNQEDIVMAEADSSQPPTKKQKTGPEPGAPGMISTNADGGGSMKLYSHVRNHNNVLNFRMTDHTDIYMRTPANYDGNTGAATMWCLLPWFIPKNMNLPIGTKGKYKIHNVHFRMSNLIMTTDSLVSTGGTLGSVTTFANTVPLNIYTDKIARIERLNKSTMYNTADKSTTAGITNDDARNRTVYHDLDDIIRRSLDMQKWKVDDEALEWDFQPYTGWIDIASSESNQAGSTQAYLPVGTATATNFQRHANQRTLPHTNKHHPIYCSIPRVPGAEGDIKYSAQWTLETIITGEFRPVDNINFQNGGNYGVEELKAYDLSSSEQNGFIELFNSDVRTHFPGMLFADEAGNA